MEWEGSERSLCVGECHGDPVLVESDELYECTVRFQLPTNCNPRMRKATLFITCIGTVLNVEPVARRTYLRPLMRTSGSAIGRILVISLPMCVDSCTGFDGPAVRRPERAAT